MHDANKIKDGFFEIVQDANTLKTTLYKDGEPVRVSESSKMLDFDELRARLIVERTQYFINDKETTGGRDNEIK